MKEKLKVVVSGLGRISWSYHLRVLARDPRFQLLAVADPVPERRKEAQDLYPGIRAYDDFSAMCDAESEADFAVIASPTTFHREQAECALNHHIAVFMEKPMCESYEAACSVAECAKKNHTPVMIFQPHRVTGAFLTFQSDVRGKLGKIFYSTRRCFVFNRRNDWQSRRSCGGGMLNNYGAHFVDQFLAAFGPGPLTVEGVQLKHAVGIGDAEDLVHLLLKTPAGISGSVEINLGSAFQEESWTVYGTLGTARWDNASKSWKIRRVEPGALPELTLQNGLAAQDRRYSLEKEIPWIEEEIKIQEPPELYYGHVFDYFASGKAPFLPLEESLELIRVLAECRKKG